MLTMSATPIKMLFATAALITASSAMALDTAKPESQGFSSERLQRLEQTMQEKIDRQELAGAVTLLARHGKVVGFNTYGQQDIASAAPMKKDSIFHIYSMTKPITAVAMMILYEEGKWLPSDPLDKYIPEFKNLKVYNGQNKDGSFMLTAPTHSPTMGELMSHTAGFSLGIPDLPLGKAYNEANLYESTSKVFIEKLAKLPLAYQPGEHWEYSVSGDIMGEVIERLSGMSYAQFIEQRILQPLGMKDTGFFVPEHKLQRLATIYLPGTDTPLAPMPRSPNISSMPSFPSPGGGLYSTAEDYFKFAQMLLNQGVLDKQRILAPSSVKLMTANHLPDTLRTGKFGIGPFQMNAGFGFGYNMGVYDEPTKAGSAAGAGTFLWIGAAGTWFWVYPTNDVIFIGLAQRWMLAPGMPNIEAVSRALVYQALTTPGK